MSTVTPKETQGEASFQVAAAGKPCKTWYKVIGDLKAGKRPLVTLHGGPGSSHIYLDSLADLASTHAIPVILYDQLGTGHSTHLREKNGDGAFWTDRLFCDELENLVSHLGIENDFDLFGHSWGGMLAARFATRQPKGLKHLIIADSPASMKLWVEAANQLKKQFPQDIQDALTKHEQNGTTHEQEYQDATHKYYARHLCRLDPWPKSVLKAFEILDEDTTVYHTMNGPSEFHIVGTLKTWSVIDDLHKINVTTLLINGRYDEAQDSVMQPFFQKIAKCKWVQFAESSHIPHYEERERCIGVLGDFLTHT